MFNDPTGHIAAFVIGMIIGAIMGGISAAMQGGNIARGILIGAITGAITGGAGSAWGTGAGAAFGAVVGAVTAKIDGGDPVKGAFMGMLGGMVGGAVGGVGGSGFGGAIARGAITGAVTGAVGAKLYGGNVWKGAVQGAVTGAASAGVSYGLTVGFSKGAKPVQADDQFGSDSGKTPQSKKSIIVTNKEDDITSHPGVQEGFNIMQELHEAWGIEWSSVTVQNTETGEYYIPVESIQTSGYENHVDFPSYELKEHEVAIALNHTHTKGWNPSKTDLYSAGNISAHSVYSSVERFYILDAQNYSMFTFNSIKNYDYTLTCYTLQYWYCSR